MLYIFYKTIKNSSNFKEVIKSYRKFLPIQNQIVKSGKGQRNREKRIYSVSQKPHTGNKNNKKTLISGNKGSAKNGKSAET